MKSRIKQLGLILTVFVAVMMSSCSSDGDGGGGGGTAPEGTVKAKVGGSNFTSMEMATTAQRISSGGSTYMIAIAGTTANASSSKTIQLILNGVDGQPGTFQIGEEGSISAVASYTETLMSNPMDAIVWAAPYEGSGITGSITISEINDTNVKGTFTFTGKNQDGTDTKQVTDGAFNVNWTN